MAQDTGKPGQRRAISPITRRILAVNVLALVVLVAGMLYLDEYRQGLIAAELAALQTQADLFAAALGEGAATTDPTGGDMLKGVDQLFGQSTVGYEHHSNHFVFKSINCRPRVMIPVDPGPCGVSVLVVRNPQAKRPIALPGKPTGDVRPCTRWRCSDSFCLRPRSAE